MTTQEKKEYQITTWSERFDLYPDVDKILCSAWPEFMLHNEKVGKHWNTFVEGFKDIQLMLMDDEEILAVINTQTIHIDIPLDNLPDEGWEWGFLKAIQDKREGVEPNFLLGFQVVINPKYQGRGLAIAAVEEMKNLSHRLGLDGVLIALRPNHKSKFPLLPMEDYLECKLDSGETFDPWLRIHERLGAQVIRVCSRAYSVKGSISDWESWTGQTFPCTGRYLVDGALNSVEISFENDIGFYIEPNVWIVHHNKQADQANNSNTSCACRY